jgi:hypothetical protein
MLQNSGLVKIQPTTNPTGFRNKRQRCKKITTQQRALREKIDTPCFQKSL